MRGIIYGLVVALVLSHTTAKSIGPISTSELESRLLAAISGVHTLRYSVDAQERIERHYLPMRSQVKLTLSPLRIYLKNDRGVEVLYVAGQNGGDAWVYPAAFPYVTLSLDPLGSLIRRNQHHSVLQVGFGLIGELLRDSDPTFVRSFHYVGDSTAAGQLCYVLRSSYPAFRYVSYRANSGETTASVATRFHCGEYRILERNKLGVNTKLALGQVIQVPTAYGSRTVVLVSQRTFLPTAVTVYDDQGLYEHYSFSNVVVNQTIPEKEFQKGYPGYKL